MKTLICCLSIFLMIPIVSDGQDVFPLGENGQILYNGIVKTDSASSKDLYLRAHSWFANSFNSAQDVIQLGDKEAGKLIGKGYFVAGIDKGSTGVVKSAVMVSVHFTAEIQTKDGRYRYEFKDFSCLRYEGTAYETACDLLSTSFVKNAVWQKSLDKDWSDVKKSVNDKMIAIIEDLKKAMMASEEKW